MRSHLTRTLPCIAGFAVLSAALGLLWHAINGAGKLSAVLNPSIGQDLTIESQVPSPLVPAVIIGLLAATALVAVARTSPPRRFQSLSPATVLLGPVVLWAFVALQWLSRAAGLALFADVDMLVFTWSEFAAASVVLLFPWVVTAVALATRD